MRKESSKGESQVTKRQSQEVSRNNVLGNNSQGELGTNQGAVSIFGVRELQTHAQLDFKIAVKQ